MKQKKKKEKEKRKASGTTPSIHSVHSPGIWKWRYRARDVTWTGNKWVVGNRGKANLWKILPVIRCVKLYLRVPSVQRENLTRRLSLSSVLFHSFIFFLNFIYFIYLFLAVVGLRFCARAFSSCGKRGPLFIAVRGPLTVAASLVAEHRLQTRRLSSCGSRA